MELLIILGVVVAVALYAVSIYNDLVKKKNLVEEGWSGIETQLKRRSNLIPNLVDTVKGYAGHERETFEAVTEMRSQTMAASDPADRGIKEGLLSAALGKLIAVAEAYPELKANENFMSLQKDLSETEDQIQLARRYYNGTVRDLNTRIESFPSNLVANTFSFQQAEFFEIQDPQAREVPKVDFG